MRSDARRRRARKILEEIRWATGIQPWTRSRTGTVRRHGSVAEAAYYLAGNPGATIHAEIPEDGAR